MGDWLRYSRFETADSADAVFAFYSNTLPNDGWRQYGRVSGSLVHYWWQDKEKRNSNAIYTSIAVENTSGNTQKPSTIIITAWLEPDPNNIPLYRGAQDRTQKDIILNDEEQGIDINERVVTYTVAATPQEVLDFYSAVLPKDGWGPNDERTVGFTGGVTYKANAHGATLGGAYALLNIAATAEAGGRTRVQLLIQGADLRDWNPE
ncbi:MAG: hypothetical protein ACJ78Q_15830 [Chloroflexia bacterium]